VDSECLTLLYTRNAVAQNRRPSGLELINMLIANILDNTFETAKYISTSFYEWQFDIT